MRVTDFKSAGAEAQSRLLRQQWLVTNGLGGFASGTLSGAINWRYHGLLVAALPAPMGRIVMLSRLSEEIELAGGKTRSLGVQAVDKATDIVSSVRLAEFRLENHLPVWRYEFESYVIEKRILMPNLQNTVHITFSLTGDSGIRLRLRPFVCFRSLEEMVSKSALTGYEVRVSEGRYEIDSHGPFPSLRLLLQGADSCFQYEGGATVDTSYQSEAERGYASEGSLWSPGYFSAVLAPGAPVTLIASTEDWHTLFALDPETAQSTETERRQRLLRIALPSIHDDFARELVLAADQFVIAPAGRTKDAARARARGDELRSVIAGYHWFTDWGRDTMISLEGLTMVTGRFQEAAWILRTFAHYVWDGLIPNMFPEGKNEGLYHTADASLWFFHAIDRYVSHTGDRETLRGLLPVLREIVERHLQGTHFNIGVDPADGLLAQGQAGYQLTWMDAKVDDWVVTPRRGKAVEINALWYNALRLMQRWLRDEGQIAAAGIIGEHATRAQTSFNRRFWNEINTCLFDVVDGEQGDDPAIRPNQLLTIALPNPVLTPDRWPAVFGVVKEKLLTPFGLRSLSPDHPDYKPTYSGDLRSRDAAYHQGTVWAWLIGPFVDAWLKVHPDEREVAREFMEGFSVQLSRGCIGSISEIFDAKPPFTERGCIAQAWSVAEVLRCLLLTAPCKVGD